MDYEGSFSKDQSEEDVMFKLDMRTERDGVGIILRLLEMANPKISLYGGDIGKP